MPKRKVPDTYVSDARIKRAVRYRGIGLTRYETAKVMSTSVAQVGKLLHYADIGLTRKKWLAKRGEISKSNWEKRGNTASE